MASLVGKRDEHAVPRRGALPDDDDGGMFEEPRRADAAHGYSISTSMPPPPPPAPPNPDEGDATIQISNTSRATMHRLSPEHLRLAEQDWSQWTERSTVRNTPYFVHDDNRTVTNINIRTSNVRLLSSTLNKFQTEVLSLVEDNMKEEGREKASQTWEVFLGKDSTRNVTSYYVIDHTARKLSWLEAEDRLAGTSKEGREKKQRQELEYWRHMALYPHRAVSKEAEDQIKQHLLLTKFDKEIKTAVGFTSARCSTFLDILSALSDTEAEQPITARTAQTQKKSGSDTIVKRYIVARLYEQIRLSRIEGRQRYLVTRSAERLRRRSLHSHKYNMATGLAALIKLSFHVCAFGCDFTQLARIEALYQHGILIEPDGWQPFLNLLINNTNQTNIVAALIFAASIGFLSITGPHVLQTNLTLAATILSLASVLFGLHHVRRHSVLLGSHQHTARDYFANTDNWMLGHAFLAFLHSLPFAFLMWSVVAFTVAIYVYAFRTIETSVISGVLLTALGIGIALLFIFMLSYFWRSIGSKWRSKRKAQLHEV